MWVVVTLGGTETLPAVVDACTEREVPCVSTTLPWQVYAAGHRPGWAFHFSWGLDDIAAVFADLWEHLGQARVVGCLWNDGTQGEALRRWFRPVAAARGHELVDLPYRESGDELPDVAGVEVLTGAATAADLAAAVRRSRSRLVTCSRWLTYPFGVARHGLDRVATIVYWTPEHAHRAAVRTPADLARGLRGVRLGVAAAARPGPRPDRGGVPRGGRFGVVCVVPTARQHAAMSWTLRPRTHCPAASPARQ